MEETAMKKKPPAHPPDLAAYGGGLIMNRIARILHPITPCYVALLSLLRSAGTTVVWVV